MGAQEWVQAQFVASVKKSGVGPPQSRSFANYRASERWDPPFDGVIAGKDASTAQLFNCFALPLHPKVKTSASRQGLEWSGVWQRSGKDSANE